MQWHDNYNDDNAMDIFLKHVKLFFKRSIMTHASFFCRQSFGLVRPFQMKRDAQYCYDPNVGYGCCLSMGSNDSYIRDNAQKCSVACRPKKHKNWDFC